MPAVKKALIVGGGTAGCAVAILLARGGVEVEVAEITPDWVVRGSGITLMGNGLRVLKQLGVWDAVRDSGYPYAGAQFRALDGAPLGEAPQPPTGGPDLPPTVGARRPRLAQILSDAAVAAGATARFNVTVAELNQEPDGVEVLFSDGERARYDVVIGADGIRSQMRGYVHPEAGQESTGAGIWRVHTRRHESVIETVLYPGGPFLTAGITPTGPDTAYAFLIEEFHDRLAATPEQLRDEFLSASEPYDDEAWRLVRSSLDDANDVNYTRIESVLLPRPWHSGRLVLIGDAVHACPPNLAQGAAMGWEDAAVVAELLLEADRIDDELFERYYDRRIERVQAVVDGSVESIRRALAHQDPDQAGLMRRVAPLLSEPA